MKNLLTLISMMLLLFSCSKDDSLSIDHESAYKKSLKKWENFKSESNNSYTYVIETYRFFSSPPSRITLTVENGILTNRSGYKMDLFAVQRPESGWTKENIREALISTNMDNARIEEMLTADFIANMDWEEDQNNLGKYDPKDLAMTIDQIYQKAKDTWLVPTKDSEAIFETDNKGIISLVGIKLKPYEDVPFNGVRIVSVTALK
ncbi:MULTISPECIES: hypothetical protein [unclassified Sphingobacterium]|uniref:hypothetical protein n=1 Tax=unclassified Sphingobacterium TaxID=2609468 RepID=UPI0020C36507|nr:MULTISPECIES: hypothetical protein [unclassified Sphingobacterium]